LREFSIYKTDMLKTESQALIGESPQLKLYSPRYVLPAGNIVKVCKEYIEDNAGKRDEYERTFRSQECPKMLADIRLDTDRCVLIGLDDHNPNDVRIPAQGLLAFKDVGSSFLIYFEFRSNGELADWTDFKKTSNNKRRHQIVRSFADIGFLLTLCQGLAAYQRAYREADRRRDNHHITRCAFSEGASRALIREIIEGDGGKYLTDIEEWEGRARTEVDKRSRQSFTGYSRALRKFCACTNREEDSPVALSLALVRDFWRYALRLGAPPLYSEYARFQQVLSRLSEYRDHLVHSVQVFLLGHRILRVLKPRDQQWHMKWALASLMHDFGLPLEKASDVIDLMFRTFSGLSPEGSAPSMMLRQMLEAHEKTHRALIMALMSPLGNQGTTDGRHGALGVLLSDVIYRGLASDRDHGFLSALYLFKYLFTRANGSMRWWQVQDRVAEDLSRKHAPGRRTLRSEEEQQVVARLAEAFACKADDTLAIERVLLEVLDAMAKHNIAAKENRLLYAQPAMFRYPDAYFRQSECVRGSELARLLVLCDTLCDWGRVVIGDEFRKFESMHREPSEGEKQPESRPECRIENITPDHDCGRVTITANYEWPLPTPLDDIVQRGSVRNLGERQWCFGRIVRCLHEDGLTGEASEDIQCHGLCHQCEGSVPPKNCLVLRELQRFWLQLVAQRVWIRPSGDLLSRIGLNITFAQQPVFTRMANKKKRVVK